MSENKAIDKANLELALSENNKRLLEYTDNADAKLRQEFGPVSKYQKYLNTELDYTSLELTNSWTAIVDNYIPFNQIKEGNMTVNESGQVLLKAGKTYKIDAFLQGEYGNILFQFWDTTNNIGIYNSFQGAKGYNLNGVKSIVYTPSEDIHIGVKCTTISSGGVITPRSTFIVQEIGRQITIDPIEHVNTTQGIEDTSVGHIISHMGNNAPAHYLICDGTEYNIEDYPYLAQHFIDEFGSVNCFGGDGVTTFAVPNINKNTSDAENVGTYGLIPKMSTYSNSTCKVTQGSEYSTYKGYYAFDRNNTTVWISDKSPSKAASDYVQVQFIDNGHRKINKISLRNANLSSYNRCKDFVFQASDDGISFDTLLTGVLPDDSTKYYDYTIASNKTYTIFRIVVKSTYNGGSTYNYGLGDVRLFGTVAFPYAFIKYEPTYYMNIRNTNYLSASLYSEEERIVGSWINGKPLYEKTIKCITPSSANTQTIIGYLPDNTEFAILDGSIHASSGSITSLNWYHGSNNFIRTWLRDSNYASEKNTIGMLIGSSVGSDYKKCTAYAVVRYTKTTDVENSFTDDMIKDYIASPENYDPSYTDEEINSAITDSINLLNEV